MLQAEQTQTLLTYHQRTKHRLQAYAEGPGQLDWDAQPAAFRQYIGSPRQRLPLQDGRFERPFALLHEAPRSPVPVSAASLGALLQLAFGISAWKSWGPQRWALRCNPSSGNLHPVEAYVLSAGLAEQANLSDGVHHYDALEHALETRAAVQLAPGTWLAVGLSTVMWREAWKYGERAFRYCQLDVGHALGALGYAAALLGWELRPLALPSSLLAASLGLDREADFPTSRFAFTEDEEPELLLMLCAPGLSVPAGEEFAASLTQSLPRASWFGQPSGIDPAPGYRWSWVGQAARASRQECTARPAPARQIPAQTAPVDAAACSASAYPPLPPHSSTAGAAALIQQRRSAQRFDPAARLDRRAFYRMLDALLPRARPPFFAQPEIASDANPGLATSGESTPLPQIHLVLFVLRVEGLPSGLYLLPRSPKPDASLLQAFTADGLDADAARLVAEFDSQCPPHLGLRLLQAADLKELQRLARRLSCHQEIAATGAFSLGMLADLSVLSARCGQDDTVLATSKRGEESSQQGAGSNAESGVVYRHILRNAGLIGQILYLEAEAAGVRGTGIGCFFDDPVREAFALADPRWQSVYHFTVGTPIVDARIETGPPYPQRASTP